jgi:chromosome segregation ATPase
VAVSRWALWVAMIVIGAPELWAGSLYYRYPSTNGTIVIDSSVPPEAVPRGYDVIRVDGSIVRTVAPQLSGAERKARALELEVAAARAEADAKNRKWDESLLLRYSSVLDIDVAKERAINNIKVRISILKSNLSVIKQQILSNQSEAAELERRGEEVPSALMNTLVSLRREVTTTEQHINGRQQDLDEAARGYERDKERFALLQSQAEKQLQYYSSDD